MKFAAGEDGTVFYNPVQVQNRDLSVLMIALHAERRRALELVKYRKRAEAAAQRATAAANADSSSSAVAAAAAAADSIDAKAKDTQADNNNDDTAPEIPGMCILDALAASGLRSLRYWKECPDVHHIAINDLDPAACERAIQNVHSNGLSEHLIDTASATATATVTLTTSARPRGICVQTGDATDILYQSRQPNRNRPHVTPIQPVHSIRQQWDVIDLDPYGSAAPFLDGAVQAVAHGGLLNITCTDMAALGGRIRKRALVGTRPCPLRGRDICRNWRSAFYYTASPWRRHATDARCIPSCPWAWTFTCARLCK